MSKNCSVILPKDLRSIIIRKERLITTPYALKSSQIVLPIMRYFCYYLLLKYVLLFWAWAYFFLIAAVGF